MTVDRWLIITCIALAAAAAILLQASFAWSHTAPTGKFVYPLACCWGPSQNRKGDCDQIPFESVHVGAAGFEITLRAGEHPLVTEPRQFSVPFDKAQKSPDGQFHLCISPTTKDYRCFFAPPFGM